MLLGKTQLSKATLLYKERIKGYVSFQSVHSIQRLFTVLMSYFFFIKTWLCASKSYLQIWDLNSNLR